MPSRRASKSRNEQVRPGKKLAFVLALVATVLCAVAFTISYLDGEFDWVPLVMGILMISLAVSSWRGSHG